MEKLSVASEMAGDLYRYVLESRVIEYARQNPIQVTSTGAAVAITFYLM